MVLLLLIRTRRVVPGATYLVEELAHLMKWHGRPMSVSSPRCKSWRGRDYKRKHSPSWLPLQELGKKALG